MTARAEGLVLMLAGTIAFRLVLGGTYDSYVRGGMRIPLLLASGFLVVLGITTAFRQARLADQGLEPAADHDHEHRPLVGWLLLVPLAVLTLIAPAPLGADATSNQDPYSPQVVERTPFPPLDEPVDGAVPLRLSTFVDRALFDSTRSLEGTPVRLTGFVVHDDELDDGFVLVRFQIACCAADALPIEVVVRDPPRLPDEDQWVEVIGTALPAPSVEADGSFPRVELTADEVVDIPEPGEPYE